MNLITYENPDFYSLLEQTAPEVFEAAHDDQGLITGFAEHGLVVPHPINNLGTILLHRAGYRMGTALALLEQRHLWKAPRETVHQAARQLMDDPGEPYAELRKKFGLIVEGARAELEVREIVMQDEPVLVEKLPPIAEQPVEQIVGNMDLLTHMQRETGERRAVTRYVLFRTLQHLVLEREMSYVRLYRLGR